MKITKLQLENFRNYSNYTYDFTPEKEITIFIGENGKGKTNFLEAIYLLSLGKSFRSTIHEDLIEWDKDYLRCRAHASIDTDQIGLEVFYSKLPARKKNFRRNDVNLRGSDYIGNLLTVLFNPEDLNMLYQSPSLRRRYLDIVLCQTDKKYLDALSNYRRVLKQRNALLTEIRRAQFQKQETTYLLNDLDAWDFEHAKFASYIVKKRLKLVEFLAANLNKIYREISGNENEKIEINYLDSGYNESLTADTLKQLLQERRQKDIIQAKTTLGPHRDDLQFKINGKEISSAASRGEFRTLLLAIKLAEILYIKEKTGQNPILLLDDVFSELDRKRQKHLLKSVQGCQTIITTTDLDSLSPDALGNQQIEIINLE